MWCHYVTPGWYSHTKSLAPHIAEPGYVKEMLKNGEDPKPRVLEECKPLCTQWRAKLERCEQKLEHVVKINPTKTCMYPYRDWVTCVEACVQPIIHNALVGAE
jgi:ubiquinol-cytochrome c reductase subunit 6